MSRGPGRVDRAVLARLSDGDATVRDLVAVLAVGDAPLMLRSVRRSLKRFVAKGIVTRLAPGSDYGDPALWGLVSHGHLPVSVTPPAALAKAVPVPGSPVSGPRVSVSPPSAKVDGSADLDAWIAKRVAAGMGGRPFVVSDWPPSKAHADRIRDRVAYSLKFADQKGLIQDWRGGTIRPQRWAAMSDADVVRSDAHGVLHIL